MRVLVVEDDHDIIDALATAFEGAEIAADFCTSVAAAHDLLNLFHFEAAVIDRSLPDGDGLALVRSLRSQSNPLPVIVLTARSGADSAIEGLRHGADDYLSKPFVFAELLARLDALLRRTDRRIGNTIACGNLTYEMGPRAIHVDDHPLDLSRRERDLIEILMRAQCRPVTFGVIEDGLCGPGGAITTNALEVSVHRLRRKLALARCTAKVLAVRGVGYRLSPS